MSATRFDSLGLRLSTKRMRVKALQKGGVSGQRVKRYVRVCLYRLMYRQLAGSVQFFVCLVSCTRTFPLEVCYEMFISLVP